MILSKSVLQTRSIFLTSIRNCKANIQSCNLHVLCVRPQLHAGTAAILNTELDHISTRFASSQTTGKDVILNLPQESNATISNAAASTSDGLPDLPVVESSSSDIPELITDLVIPLNKLGEPTLQYLGLGSYWTPAGWIQNLLEFMHCTFDLPWWGCISICVVTARLLLFPLVISGQKNAIKLHNAMPKMQEIQIRMRNSQTYGNHMETVKIGAELAQFMREKQINPAKSVIMPAVQAPIFFSFFVGLRGMANKPVESMTTGGLYWFEDLTVCDPYYILPAITSVSLFLTLQVGMEMSQMPSTSITARVVPKVMKILPIAIFPFIMYFPSAVCVYWATTNIVSLVQVLFLRIPKVRTYFEIDKKEKHIPSESPLNKDGFVGGMKKSWSNMKIAKEIEERQRLDDVHFRKAGRAPPVKTFKENPILKEAAVQAKKN